MLAQFALTLAVSKLIKEMSLATDCPISAESYFYSLTLHRCFLTMQLIMVAWLGG